MTRSLMPGVADSCQCGGHFPNANWRANASNDGAAHLVLNVIADELCALGFFSLHKYNHSVIQGCFRLAYGEQQGFSAASLD